VWFLASTVSPGELREEEEQISSELALTRAFRLPAG